MEVKRDYDETHFAITIHFDKMQMEFIEGSVFQSSQIVPNYFADDTNNVDFK